jgi:hypothetical protein
VFKLPRPLHIPDALRLSSLDFKISEMGTRFPALRILTRGWPSFLTARCYILDFPQLHERRLSSVIEYGPLRYATLAYLEVARAGVVTINALSFLDQFYVHTRDILAKPAYLDLMHAAILVLCVLQGDRNGPKGASGMDVAEKELFFISMIVRCFNSCEPSAHVETGRLFSWLLKGCIRRLVNLPFTVGLSLPDAIHFTDRMFESVPPPSLQKLPPSFLPTLPIYFHFLKYVASCQAESWLGKRAVCSARESLSSAFSEILDHNRPPIPPGRDRDNYDLYLNYIGMLAAIRTILEDAPSGRRNVAKIEVAKWLMLPLQFDFHWKRAARVVAAFFAGLILTPASFPEGISSRQRHNSL